MVIALGNSTDNKAADLLTPLVKDDKLDLGQRREATRAMAKIYNGAVRLIKMSEAKQLDDRLRAAAALPLNTAQWDQVRKFAIKEFPLPAAKDDVQLPPLPELIAMKGDVERGKKIFETTGTCAKCHVVNKGGKEVGPNLSEIGSKLSRQAFFESVLYPSAGISHNYETYAVVLDNGTVVTGIVTNKTDAEVTIKGADALLRTFPTAGIDELQKQDVSLMPADLQKVLSAQDLADVVDYMQTLKKAVATAN
jgi:putative heme-binding domain-containing protein